MSRNSNDEVTLWYGNKKELTCLAVIDDPNKIYFPDIYNNGDIERVQFVPYVDMIAYANQYSNRIWENLIDKFDKDEKYHISCNDVSHIVFNAILDALEGLRFPTEREYDLIGETQNKPDSGPNERY